ncbi:M56 family metallopeptidase [Kaistella palustris]|uniref:M56 family metallopeptidase n=1 Tax=Kaistella palustris TaxID=493376 RepID=UPI001F42793D|nr:M56 family metallopeptidase [Kaistella palustris]
MYLLINNLQYFNATTTSSNDFTYLSVIAFGFGLVAVFFITKLIFGLFRIQFLKKKFQKENFEGISFYQTNLENAPFSFFKNLFWKNSILIQSDLGRQILKHEMVHIEQKHSWDKIFLEITTSLFWFNPFFYLIKKEINLIHEYLADHKALKNSDTKAFAQMLLASHFSGKQLPATSPFLSSNLKKRLTMLKKSKTKFSYARRILALPLLFILAFMYLVNAKNKEIRNTNLEVEYLISTLKSDTISPNIKDQNALNETSLESVQAKIGEKQNEIQPLQESFNAKNEEARKIGEDLRLKSDELRKLSDKKDFDNPMFKNLNSEINDLSAKMDAIYGKEDFKNVEKLLNEKYGEMDQLYAKLDAYYNSADFKNRIKEAEEQGKVAEKLVNSAKFKKQIADAEKQARKAEKLINSPKFKKQIADAEKKAEEAVKQINSTEIQQSIKDAEQAMKDAQVALRDSKTAMNDSQISLNDSKNSALNKNENTRIFIDGKSATNEEMQKLDPNKIESMNIFKKGFEGKKNGEIYIKLKK